MEDVFARNLVDFCVAVDMLPGMLPNDIYPRILLAAANAARSLDAAAVEEEGRLDVAAGVPEPVLKSLGGRVEEEEEGDGEEDQGELKEGEEKGVVRGRRSRRSRMRREKRTWRKGNNKNSSSREAFFSTPAAKAIAGEASLVGLHADYGCLAVVRYLVFDKVRRLLVRGRLSVCLFVRWVGGRGVELWWWCWSGWW